jgi:G:T/U-mismatch repair DNA glycosylase
MPGKESSEKKQYYANSRNQFWKMIYTLLDTDINDKYEDETVLLSIILKKRNFID